MNLAAAAWLTADTGRAQPVPADAPKGPCELGRGPPWVRIIDDEHMWGQYTKTVAGCSLDGFEIVFTCATAGFEGRNLFRAAGKYG